jgi:DNA-binding PadR family transcriptional regulator
VALLKGTLDVLVLKTLSWTPMHAFEISTWLDNRSGGQVVADDAALLQALHRLETRRLIGAAWGMTKNGRRARYYELTTQGRAFLRAESERLVEHFGVLVSILESKRA